MRHRDCMLMAKYCQNCAASVRLPPITGTNARLVGGILLPLCRSPLQSRRLRRRKFCRAYAGHRRIQCKTRSTFWRKAGFSEGKIKRTWHYVASVLQIVVCTLFSSGASGTPFFDPACRDPAQGLGFAGFRPAPWPPNVRFLSLAGGTGMSATTKTASAEARSHPPPRHARRDQELSR